MENNIPTPPLETIQRVRTLLERIQKTPPTDTRAYLEAHAELVGMGYEAGCAIHALVEPQITRERKKIAKHDACKTPLGYFILRDAPSQESRGYSTLHLTYASILYL